MDLADPTIKKLYEAYSTRAIIYRFNRFWPKTEHLNQWIHQTWSIECEISLWAKGFFIVYFENPADYKQVIENGPWFWGRERSFITPWKSNFDLAHASVTITLVWDKLLNLPIHFCSIEVLKEIGNTLGRFVVVVGDCLQTRMATYICHCVEVDLSEGFHEQITLKWNSKTWVQDLDYENTTFRCRFYLQTWHLQGTCPMARPPKKRNPKPRMKRWDSPDPNNNREIEDEDDGLVQNAKNKETKEEMNQDIREDHHGKESMQCTKNSQKDYGIADHIDLA